MDLIFNFFLHIEVSKRIITSLQTNYLQIASFLAMTIIGDVTAREELRRGGEAVSVI
jgi:hypothetical protein